MGGEVVQLPGTEAPPPAELGTCEWCRAAQAVERFEVTPAKNVRGRPREPHECAVTIPVCAGCRERLEQRRAEAAERAERERLERQRRARARANRRRRL